MITKRELLPLLVERLVPMLASRGFRYLKSQEIFQAKVLDTKIWMNSHLTYWLSGKYCDFSPFVSVRYESIARFIDNYSEKKADVRTPTLGFKVDDQLYEGQ